MVEANRGPSALRLCSAAKKRGGVHWRQTTGIGPDMRARASRQGLCDLPSPSDQRFLDGRLMCQEIDVARSQSIGRLIPVSKSRAKVCEVDASSRVQSATRAPKKFGVELKRLPWIRSRLKSSNDQAADHLVLVAGQKL